MQPRWLLLDYFHDVLIMEHSRLFYGGGREALLPLLYEAEATRSDSFSGVGNLPRMAALDGGGGGGGPAAPRHPESCLNSLYILCASTRPSDMLEPPGVGAARSKAAAEVAGVLRDTADGRVTVYEPRAGGRSAPNVLLKLFYMTQYGLQRAAQNVVQLVVSYVVSFAAFLLLGWVYGTVMILNNASIASETIQNGTGLIFFFVSLAFLYNVLHIEPFRGELQVFQQHRAQGYYGGGLFVVWLVLSNGARRAVFCMLMILGVFIIDPVLGFSGLQHLVVVFGLVSFVTLALAWAVIAWFPNARQLTVMVFVATYAVSALFGGLFINLLSLPETLRQLSFISVIRLGFEAAIVGQFYGNKLGCNTTAVVPGTTTTTTTATTMTTRASASGGAWSDPLAAVLGAEACLTGDAYIESVGFSESRQWANLLPITYITIVFVAIAAAGIWYNRKAVWAS